jgi:hypothetical protein
MSNIEKTRAIVTRLFNRGFIPNTDADNVNEVHNLIISVLDEEEPLSINMPVAYEMIKNVIVTAIEGGSNYWYKIPDHSYDVIKSIEPDQPISVGLARAVMIHNIDIDIEDIENDETVGTLSYNKIKERLKVAYEDEDVMRNLMAFISDDYDADNADVVFQYLVMGEIVYG